MIRQYEIRLTPKERGIHLVTGEIVQQLNDLPEQGLLHLFLLHTSASIGLNENADANVRVDLHRSLENMVPEGQPHFKHVQEGPDDMPSHIKSAMIGHQITIPITQKTLALGTWQGIYFYEFRNRGGSRKILVTLYS